MAQIKKLDELANIEKYRKFLKAELSSLRDGDPIFISKEDFGFDLKGTEFPSRAVLFGSKAASSAAALKKQGIDWREGTCVVLPDGIGVDGIASSILKAGQRTLQKLVPGLKLKPSSGVSDDSDDGDEKDDRKARTRATKARKTATDALRAYLATGPSDKSQVSRAYKAAQEAEKAGDYETAAQRYEDLADQARTSSSAADRSRPSSSDRPDAAYARRRKSVIAEVRTALAARPSNSARIRKLVEGLKKFEAAEQFEKAKKVLTALADEVEAASASADPTPPEVEDESPEPVAAGEDETRNLADYAKQLRAEFRRLPALRDRAEPLFIGRQPVEFDHKGQGIELFSIIAGLRSVKHAKELRKSGVRLLEGLAWTDGKTVLVEGIPASYVKRAAKDLKRLKLGFDLEVAGEDVPDEEPEELELEEEDVEEPQRDLTDYRKFLRAQLRRLPGSPADEAPFFVSRKPIEFDAEGRRQAIHAIFVGRKSVPQVKAFKREGNPFVEGTCWVEGNEVVVADVPGGLLRQSAKALKALKLGFSISASSLETAEEEAEAAAAGETATGTGGSQARTEPTGIRAGTIEYRKALLHFRSNIVPTARNDVRALTTRVRSLPGEEDLAKTLSERLDRLLAEVDDVIDTAMNAADDHSDSAIAEAKNRLGQIRNSLASDPLVGHCDSNPFGITVGRPVIDGLGRILATIV